MEGCDRTTCTGDAFLFAFETGTDARLVMDSWERPSVTMLLCSSCSGPSSASAEKENLNSTLAGFDC